MTEEELNALDKAVAELQGWRYVDHRKPYWVKSELTHIDDIINVESYHPTRNREQAMELLEKYHVGLLWNGDGFTSGIINGVTTQTGETPMIAICKAVIALEGKDG